jgi:GAF domain-containing protein
MDDSNAGPAGDGLVGMAAALLDDDALHELLQKLTVLAQHTVTGSQSVSITIVEDGNYRTTNSTGPDALEIDKAQYRDNNGPCLDAMRSKRQLQAALDESPRRCPRFGKEAREAGVRSVLSTPLVGTGGGALGALNIYAREGGSFECADTRTAELLGEQATVLVERALALVSANRLNDQLRQALATREIIGEAKGILMETQSCTRDQAFDILRRASQRENRKLRELAEELVLRVEARAGQKL